MRRAPVLCPGRPPFQTVHVPTARKRLEPRSPEFWSGLWLTELSLRSLPLPGTWGETEILTLLPSECLLGQESAQMLRYGKRFYITKEPLTVLGFSRVLGFLGFQDFCARSWGQRPNAFEYTH